MTQTKFTKGEWSIQPIEDDKEYIRIRGTVIGGRFKIANVVDQKSYHDGSEWCKREREESAANAYLIAAAPEMYELLSELSEMNSEDAKLFIENSDEIQLILAKARGE